MPPADLQACNRTGGFTTVLATDPEQASSIGGEAEAFHAGLTGGDFLDKRPDGNLKFRCRQFCCLDHEGHAESLLDGTVAPAGPGQLGGGAKRQKQASSEQEEQDP